MIGYPYRRTFQPGNPPPSYSRSAFRMVGMPGRRTCGVSPGGRQIVKSNKFIGVADVVRVCAPALPEPGGNCEVCSPNGLLMHRRIIEETDVLLNRFDRKEVNSHSSQVPLGSQAIEADLDIRPLIVVQETASSQYHLLPSGTQAPTLRIAGSGTHFHKRWCTSPVSSSTLGRGPPCRPAT